MHPIKTVKKRTVKRSKYRDNRFFEENIRWKREREKRSFKPNTGLPDVKSRREARFIMSMVKKVQSL